MSGGWKRALRDIKQRIWGASPPIPRELYGQDEGAAS